MSRPSPKPLKLFHPSRRLVLTSAAYALVALLSAPVLLAQNAQVKWGKVPKTDLEMEVFPADTNASAVILWDYGETYFSDTGTLVYRRHSRIKILREAGYKWATFEVPYYARRRIQRVRRFEGQTFNLTPEGKIKKVKLDKKSIFDEDIDGRWRKKKATLPALQPGSVIEYRYEVESEDLRDLRSWTFQASEPVLWSEYRIWAPKGFRYLWVAHLNDQELDVAEAKDQVRFGGMGRTNRWVMKNIPALRREPYMTTPKDYRARVEVQLSQIVIPGVISRNFTTTWEKLSKELLESRYFGRQLNKRDLLPEDIQSEILRLPSPQLKMIAVHDYLQQNIKWNELLGLYAREDIKEAFKKRIATGTEISFMLISILREFGIEASPVIISTRSHGKLQQIYPILEQFNHVITAAEIGGKIHLLDPRGSHRPYNLLPLSDLNQSGFLVHKKKPRWLKISPQGKYERTTTVTVSVDEDGNVTGQAQVLFSGYSAVSQRKSLEDQDETDYVKDLLDDDMAEVTIDSFQIENVNDLMKPLAVTAHFSTPGYPQAAGEFLYFDPVLIGRYDENPFKLEKRSFPVDFGYPRAYSYVLNLQIPKSYAVEELPPNRSDRLAGRGAELYKVVHAEGQTLQLKRTFKVNKTVFQPARYPRLRQFFDNLVNSDAELIVLRRNPRTAGEGEGR